MSLRVHGKLVGGAALAVLLATGCGGGQSSLSSLPTTQNQMRLNMPSPAGGHSVLKQLNNQVVIGSTIDPVYGQLNPYGLDVAKSTNGVFTKGDLAVCNFNDSYNVQGTGYTIVALHPIPGSTPSLVASDPTTLTGCDALALGWDDTIYASAFVSNDNPIFSSSGSLITNLSGSPFNGPFGETYAQSMDKNRDGENNAAVYESNATDGSIVRINLPKLTTDVVATGFPVNGGQPGGILGPSGLQYDSHKDTLYVVDGQNNSVTAIRKVSRIGSGCAIRVTANGHRFGGRCGSKAKIIYSGAPLNGPISSALLFNGSLVIGNTLDSAGQNLMIELSSNGKVLDVRNVDTGAAGAIFGMVATGTNASNTKLYFNDDNANNLQVLEH